EHRKWREAVAEGREQLPGWALAGRDAERLGATARDGRGGGGRLIRRRGFDHGDTHELRGRGLERDSQATQDVRLWIFLAVFQMRNSVAAQICDVRELADAETAALARLT